MVEKSSMKENGPGVGVTVGVSVGSGVSVGMSVGVKLGEGEWLGASVGVPEGREVELDTGVSPEEI
jgi:hypothetical protein